MYEAEVIIPTHNDGPRLTRAVESALALPFVSRVIVVDDGSRTSPALPHDERVALIRQENAGPAAARNRGLDASSAPWVIFCDADDALLPAAEDALALATGLGAVACVSGRLEVFPDGSRTPRPAPAEWSGRAMENPAAVFKPIALFGTPGLLVSRRVIEAGLRFDPALRHGEDREFIRRIADLGPVAVSPALVVEYTKHPADAGNLNAPRHLERRIADFRRILAKHHDNASDPYFRESARWLLNAASKAGVPEPAWRSLIGAFREHRWRVPIRPRLRRLVRRPSAAGDRSRV